MLEYIELTSIFCPMNGRVMLKIELRIQIVIVLIYHHFVLSLG